jgi:hypothetical protein
MGLPPVQRVKNKQKIVLHCFYQCLHSSPHLVLLCIGGASLALTIFFGFNHRLCVCTQQAI